ncbi:hypothetical protein [Salinispora arenicola]|uniref:hypothetical protein n=1 Tax=Salinispora arenicola TaxID=168697 RepID=UPI000371DF88|nr:hypothetical protein [Salinispora arenicola]
MMMLDPVGVSDIAERSHASSDLVEQWAKQATFPRPQAGRNGTRLWEWRAVEEWLLMSRRLPSSLRYRDMGNGDLIEVQSLEEDEDGCDRWVTYAAFFGSDNTGWRAYPKAAMKEEASDPADARDWAESLLQGWIDARMKWVRKHPDEPMPPHLTGVWWR